MRIVVTGGCGFIGVNLVRHLLEKGHKIKVFDNLSVGSKENLENATKKYELPKLIIGDVRDQKTLIKAVENVDAVIHLAAHTSVVDSMMNPEENYHVNALGTFNVLEACRKHRIKKMVYASSNAVVGEQQPPIDETKIPAPLSPYGASKLAGEALCSAYFNSYGIKTIALRFSNVYGPHTKHKTSVIAKFIENSKTKKPIVIYGEGNQTRDFIHVSDICEAIYLSLHSDYGGEIFQVGTGSETRIDSLAEMVSDLAISEGFTAPVIIREKPREGEIIKNVSDISKIQKFLGFAPKITLEEGLKETFYDYN